MSESSVTCAWCNAVVGFGEEHGEGVCTVTVTLAAYTHRADTVLAELDAVIANAYRNALRASDEALLSSLPDPDLRMPADTPRVMRSPHVPSRSTAWVLDGSMFADGQLRVLLAESTSSEIVEAVREQLEERTRAEERVQDLLASVERLFPARTPSGEVPVPVLFPWQEEIIRRVMSGEPLQLDTRPRRTGKSIVDRLLADVCSACRTVGGHAPTCVTRVEAQLSALTSESEGDPQ